MKKGAFVLSQYYEPEFKQLIVRLHIEEGRTYRSLTAEYGVSKASISRAVAYIKPLLVQCSLAAIRKKSNPEIRSRYLNLKKQRGHKKAIIAIARMFLTAIYNMIKRNKKYNAALYREADVSP